MHLFGCELMKVKGRDNEIYERLGMRQMLQEALNLSVDLLTTAGTGEDFRKEISGTEILLYEE